MKLNTEEVNSAPAAATHKIGRAKLNNAKMQNKVAFWSKSGGEIKWQ